MNSKNVEPKFDAVHSLISFLSHSLALAVWIYVIFAFINHATLNVLYTFIFFFFGWYFINKQHRYSHTEIMAFASHLHAIIIIILYFLFILLLLFSSLLNVLSIFVWVDISEFAIRLFNVVRILFFSLLFFHHLFFFVEHCYFLIPSDSSILYTMYVLCWYYFFFVLSSITNSLGTDMLHLNIAHTHT